MHPVRSENIDLSTNIKKHIPLFMNYGIMPPNSPHMVSDTKYGESCDINIKNKMYERDSG